MDRREFIKWMAATTVAVDGAGVFAQETQGRLEDQERKAVMSQWIWLPSTEFANFQHCRKDTYSSPKVTDGPGFAVVQFRKVV